MAGKLSPGTQARLAELGTLLEKVHRAHNLVEQYAAARTNAEQFLLPLTRTFGQLKLQFTGAGLDAMAQLAGSMEIASRRGLSQSTKIRVLREGVGSLKFQVELEQRTLVSENRAAQPKAQDTEPAGGAEETPGAGPADE
jgi:hypothetical protein